MPEDCHRDGSRGATHRPCVPRVVPVELGPERYDIHIGPGLLDRIGELVPARPGARAVLVTCDGLPPDYARRCLAALEAAGWSVAPVVVPDGEQSKSLVQAGSIHEHCLDAGLDRGGTVFALGGGVVGDLAGFVAATYMRGIAFVQAPTTLLSQVDASVGGKTAVDLPQAKNAVGAFHQPVAVVIDVATLATLPDREFRSGMAEVVKHAAIADADLFEWLEARAGDDLRSDLSGLTEVVARNCRIKADVVVADPRETGPRACLNFGHTIGHALEAAAADWGLRHGEAVAAGMVAESETAVRLGLAELEVPRRLRALLQALGLSPRPEQWNPEVARTALRHDKKVVDGRLRLPLVPEIGQVTVTEDVPVTELLAALDELTPTGA